MPKLNRAELESACEDFSNIIGTLPECTLYKGTLSSGVEIAVASTTIKSAKDWSKQAEMHFRKKVLTFWIFIMHSVIKYIRQELNILISFYFILNL